MSTINWGIIGCGNVTEVKSGPAFQKAEGSRLVAVMRRQGHQAEDYARRHGVPRWYDRADLLVNDPEVSAIYVATPPGTHLQYAFMAAAAGKPCYVEKPMARNHAECQQMVQAFQKANLPLFVAYYRRGLPRFLKVKELVDAGKLGRLTNVTLRYSEPRHRHIDAGNLEWRLLAEHSGGGIALDLASHMLDIVDFIAGPIRSVTGTAVNLASPYDVEDGAVLHGQFESGALCTGLWNFAAGVREDVLEFTGTEGRATLSTFGNEPVRFISDHHEESFDRPNPPHVQQPLIQSIVNQLLGRGTCPSAGISAARTSLVIDHMLDGYYGGRSDAFWSRPAAWPGRRR